MTCQIDPVLIEIYRQNWEQTRHLEIQRLSFTSIYGAIVAGTLALGFKEKAGPNQWVFVASILSVIAIFGFAMTLKWNAELKNHFRAIAQTKRESYMNDPRTNFSRFIALPLDIQPKVHSVFSWFYVAFASVWLGVTVFCVSAWRETLWSHCFGWCMCLAGAIVLASGFAIALFVTLLIVKWVHEKEVEHQLDP